MRQEGLLRSRGARPRGPDAGALYDHARGMYPGFEQADEHLRRSLVYFDEAEADPDPISLDGPAWYSVKRRIGEMAEGF